MSRFQGIGTAYYGKSSRNPQDNSYVTIKWFVLLLLPIVPLKALRVIKLGKQEKNYLVAWSQVVGYKTVQELSLKNHIGLILLTYLFVYGGIALYIASWFLININDSLVYVPLALTAILLIWGGIKSE